jgi:hypothetical protein
MVDEAVMHAAYRLMRLVMEAMVGFQKCAQPSCTHVWQSHTGNAGDAQPTTEVDSQGRVTNALEKRDVHAVANRRS